MRVPVRWSIATVILAGVASLALLGAAPAASADPLASRLGRDCKVQFRRDYLGAACPSPVTFTVDTINGSVLSLVGELTGVNESWVVLRTIRRETTEARSNVRKDEFWIPRDAVLLVQFDSP